MFRLKNFESLQAMMWP